MAKSRLRIKELLKEKGMTQVYLAERLDISPVSLNQQLSRNTFTLDRLEEIAEIFGVRVIDLFDNSIEIECPECHKRFSVSVNINGIMPME